MAHMWFRFSESSKPYLDVASTIFTFTLTLARADQSVVALTTGLFSDLPTVMKFFPVAEKFHAELAVRETPLVSFAPRIIMLHDPAENDMHRGGTRDKFGRLLPPCIVMPRGESLLAWLDRAATDRFQAVSVRRLGRAVPDAAATRELREAGSLPCTVAAMALDTAGVVGCNHTSVEVVGCMCNAASIE